MATPLLSHKVVASLPGSLAANSIYYVRVGAGFDVYVTNDLGTVVAYPLNSSGGATGDRGYTTLDFGSGEPNVKAFVTGQAGIVSGSVVHAQLAGKNSSEHSIDEHFVEELDVMAGEIIPGTGFTIFGKSRNVPLRGDYIVSWSWR